MSCSRLSLADVMAREGLAEMIAGRQGGWSDRVAEALEVLGDDRSSGTAVAALTNDAAGRSLDQIAEQALTLPRS